MRYAVVEWYESDEGDVLGIELTKGEADALVAQRIEDTDDECDILVYDNERDRDVYFMLMEKHLRLSKLKSEV